jgi:hypothetical protein
MEHFRGLRILHIAAKAPSDAQGSRSKGVCVMRFFKTAMTAAMAVSMMAVPTIAQASAQNRAAVSKLSVGAAPVARLGAPVRDTNKDGGSIIIALLAAAAVIAGIIIAADNNNSPTSA